MTTEQIIHAKYIITSDHKNPVLEDHALVIENDKIKNILPSQKAGHAGTHFKSHAILPGLINSHTHIAMSLFRGIADDLALMDWLTHHVWPAEKKWVSNEFVYDASLFAMAEMIRSGTTCFNDMYFFLEATAKAADLSGMRAHIGMTVIDVPTAWAKTPDEYFEKGLQFFEEYKHHARITPTMAPHAIYTVSEKNLERVRDIAEKYQLKINMHIQESAPEVEQSIQQTGLRPVKRLDNLGLISPQLIAIHMTQINEEDLSILSAKKPSIVHCPESNMKLASGACPVTQLQKNGLTVALGTDGVASNNDTDMLGEMRTAAFLAKHVTKNPESLPAIEALKMATLNGAKALGSDHFTGSLEVGKAADFIAIELDEIETMPLYHPISHIVYAASRQQVTDVWIAGKQVLKNRELLTLDENELKAKARMWGERIRSGS